MVDSPQSNCGGATFLFTGRGPLSLAALYPVGTIRVEETTNSYEIDQAMGERRYYSQSVLWTITSILP